MGPLPSAVGHCAVLCAAWVHAATSLPRPLPQIAGRSGPSLCAHGRLRPPRSCHTTRRRPRSGRQPAHRAALPAGRPRRGSSCGRAATIPAPRAATPAARVSGRRTSVGMGGAAAAAGRAPTWTRRPAPSLPRTGARSGPTARTCCPLWTSGAHIPATPPPKPRTQRLTLPALPALGGRPLLDSEGSSR